METGCRPHWRRFNRTHWMAEQFSHTQNQIGLKTNINPEIKTPSSEHGQKAP